MGEIASILIHPHRQCDRAEDKSAQLKDLLKDGSGDKFIVGISKIELNRPSPAHSNSGGVVICEVCDIVCGFQGHGV